jgi:Spy/CpxP family protein refolding chaperone
VSLVQAAARSGTRQHLLKTLLVLSLALNLFFMVGALWIRVHAPPQPTSPEQRLQQMADELGLDPRQRAAFAGYSRSMRERLQSMHDVIRPLVSQAWSEVAKPQADETRIMQAMDEVEQKRRDFVRDMTTRTLSFLAILSPEQRRKFVELAHQRPRPWTPPNQRDGSR